MTRTTTTVRRLLKLPLAAALLTLATACGFSPPEDCSVDAGSADEALFASHFSSMELDSPSGARTNTGGDSQWVFSPSTAVHLVVDSLHETQVQVCVTERKGGGKLVYDQEHTIGQGESRVVLGSFAPNPYVVRIGVDGALARNLTFAVE